MSQRKRAVIFANGEMSEPEAALEALHPEDILIAADGGARYCRDLNLTPDYLIGDFDSLEAAEVDALQAQGAEVIRHPARKDFTDLELAIRHAESLGASEILVLGALGRRWDQTLANLLLPAAVDLSGIQISLLDGAQEVTLLRGGENLTIHGQAGDIVSLIPLGGDASGVSTHGLEYALTQETLFYGSTRGISNVLLGDTASVQSESGLLMCVVIHQRRNRSR